MKIQTKPLKLSLILLALILSLNCSTHASLTNPDDQPDGWFSYFARKIGVATGVPVGFIASTHFTRFVLSVPVEEYDLTNLTATASLPLSAPFFGLMTGTTTYEIVSAVGRIADQLYSEENGGWYLLGISTGETSSSALIGRLMQRTFPNSSAGYALGFIGGAVTSYGALRGAQWIEPYLLPANRRIQSFSDALDNWGEFYLSAMLDPIFGDTSE